MSKKFGPDLLREQVLESVAGEMDWMIEESPGSTPIEKLLSAALTFHVKFVTAEISEILFATDIADLEKLLAMPRIEPSSLVILPQAQLEGWRVDFLVHVLDFDSWLATLDNRTERKWTKLIVECDGHDFHERTKEQAKKDRSRDREWQLKKIEVFRFTGSEIWKDPLGCSRQILDWAVRSWA